MVVREKLTYLLCGAMATGVHAGVAVVGTYFGSPQWLANCIAFAVANLAAHQVNSRFTFRTRPSWANYRKYLAVSLIGLVYCTAAGAAGDANGWPALHTIILIAATLPLVTYVGHSRWTFAGTNACD